MTRDERAAAVQSVLQKLQSEGVEGIWVDRAPVFDKATLLHALYQALQLPAWFGFNWDALADTLSADDDLTPRALVFHDFALLEDRDPDTARIFLEIVEDVALSRGNNLRVVR